MFLAWKAARAMARNDRGARMARKVGGVGLLAVLGAFGIMLLGSIFGQKE